MSAKLEVKLVHSTIGCPPDQRATVRGLGLRKLQQQRVLEDTPCVRGMITKVKHLVVIVEKTPTVKKPAVKPVAKKEI